MADTLSLLDHRIDVLSGVVSASQRVRQRLLFLNGEWFLDQRLGTPYRTTLLGEHVAPELAVEELRAVALAVEGVDSVEVISYEYDGSSGRLTAKLRIDDTNGESSTIEVAPNTGS